MMDLSLFNTIFLVISAVILFLYGLEHFSREIQHIGEASFKNHLEKFASNRWRGFALGAFFTALVQSSSAVSALTVTLVNSGMISFSNSLAILFGTNVGTTLTAQIVAYKLTGIGPVFIVLGTILSLLKYRVRVFGRLVFYFGFIFFSLDLISQALKPIQNSPWLLDVLSYAESPFWAVLLGAVVTFVVQSSSVSTGLVVILVQQNTLTLPMAICLILGSNIGTTGTALIASLEMDRKAKVSALANTLFNVIGVFVVLPLLPLFLRYIDQLATDNPSQVVASTHLMFNVSVSILFLLYLKPFEKLVVWLSDRLIRTSRY